MTRVVRLFLVKDATEWDGHCREGEKLRETIPNVIYNSVRYYSNYHEM